MFSPSRFSYPFLLTQTIACLSFGSFASVSHAATPQPCGQDLLLQKLQGSWVAKGVRVSAITGRDTQIEGRVKSACDAGDTYLVSENQVQETTLSEGGAPLVRTYERVYWVSKLDFREPSLETPSSYGLGSLKELTRPSICGEWNGEVFRVIQNLPTQPPVRVISETQFPSSTNSVYRERVYQGDRLLSRSEIAYTRTQP